MTRDGRLVIDDPEVRRQLIEAIDSYTAIYRKGGTPPGPIDLDLDYDNNEPFLAQAVVMTLNETLSIPNALKHERPDDYYETPRRSNGRSARTARPSRSGATSAAAVFKDGGNVETAKEFVRFLVAEGGLAHYLDFAGERMLPAMPKLSSSRSGWIPATRTVWRGDADRVASNAIRLRHGDWRLAHDLVWAGDSLGQGDPPRRRRGHQPRAGGRRGDRPDQGEMFRNSLRYTVRPGAQ